MLELQKMYRSGGSWHDVSEDDVIAQTEVQGFLNKGTVISLLEKGYEVRTPYAIFRAANVKRRYQYFGDRKYIRRA